MSKTTPLRRVRLQRGLSIKEVADGAGVDVGNLSRLERGQLGASKQTAEQLARYYGHAVTEMQILYPERYVSDTA